MLTPKNKKGFSLVELLIVMAILGILVALAIPQLFSYRVRQYNMTAKYDAKNAYTIAHAYFTDHPSGVPSLTELEAYGFSRSKNVTVIPNMGINHGTITTYHAAGDTTYTIDYLGSFH